MFTQHGICAAANVACYAGFVESVQVFLDGSRAGLGRRTAAAGHYVLQYVNCFFYVFTVLIAGVSTIGPGGN